MEQKPRVLLIGDELWRGRVRGRSPDTDFIEVEVLTSEPGDSVALVITQSAELASSPLLMGPTGTLRRRVFACDSPASSNLPDGAFPIPLEFLDDGVIAFYLPGTSGVEPVVHEYRDIERWSDLSKELVDLAGNILMSWKLQPAGRADVGRIGIEAFNRHLDVLKASITNCVEASLIDGEYRFSRPDRRPQTRLITCFYVCERTVCFARSGPGGAIPYFASSVQDGRLGEWDDQIEGHDGILTALFIVLMNSAPSASPVPAEIAVEPDLIRVRFMFPLRPPDGEHILDSPGFVDRLGRESPNALGQFGAVLHIRPDQVELVLRRSVS